MAYGPARDSAPLVLVALRDHAHDALNPHHDRDHVSLIFFAPAVLSSYNVCAIGVSPSFRFSVNFAK